MTNSDDRDALDQRLLLAASGYAGMPEAHLEPLVSAELSWGNSIRQSWRRTDRLLDDRRLTLARPLHVDLLRQTFRFPPSIGMYAVLPRPATHQEGRLMIGDSANYVGIDSPLPKDWSFGEGPVEL
jgi:hypothetical protein